MEAPLLDQVPEPQGKQSLMAVLPGFELYFPAGQLLQEAEPLEDNVPGGHVWHASMVVLPVFEL